MPSSPARHCITTWPDVDRILSISKSMAGGEIIQCERLLSPEKYLSGTFLCPREMCLPIHYLPSSVLTLNALKESVCD